MTDDDQVRRLLADARHTEPLPEDVAARLDDTLADLRADRPVRSAVTDLAAARRRRRARNLLIAAAAAVVVVGLGIDQLGDLQMSGGGDDAASSADAGGSGDRPQAERERPRDELNGAESAPRETDGSLARVTAEDFGAYAFRLRDHDKRFNYLTSSDATTSLDKAECPAGNWGRGRAVRIRYDGSPAALVYRAPRGETQVVDLFLCGSEAPTRSITLSAP
jgi:hypothetical protein